MLKKLFALVGVTVVAAGAGAACYHKRVKDSGLTFEEKVAKDKEELQKYLSEQEKEAKKALDLVKKQVKDLAEGFEEGLQVTDEQE